MPLDGIYLCFIKREIEAFIGARVEKIAQPSRDELILHLRGRERSGKLLLSGGAASPRVHFIERAPENPKTPPMFCMLLRKRLGGGKLMAVRQMGLDRVLHLDFEASDELGDLQAVTIIIEIMGRHSNVIVVDGNRKIIDSIRRVDIGTSRVRQILPGMTYLPPPAQEKMNILVTEPSEIVAAVRRGRDVELSKALAERVEGFSQLTCREAAYYAVRGAEVSAADIDDEQASRLAFFLNSVADSLRGGMPSPNMILEPDGRPRDFCCIPVRQYGVTRITRDYPDCSSLLEGFFADRERMERVRQRSGDLLTLLAGISERITRRLAAQREELLRCADRGRLKEIGDLIGANLSSITQGDSSAEVWNFYDESGGTVTIELDPRLTPAQNAQRYYALYRKADTAEKHLEKLIAQGEQELVYIDSVFDALTRADGEAELDAIRAELAGSGYLRRAPKASGKRPVKEQKLSPLRYRSSDGFTILCGRNNIQNDRLTLKDAGKADLWLHTQKIPGSHVIVLSKGETVPDSTIAQAAAVAAYNSKGRGSSKVPVDYTQVKNVRKPSGSAPGMVIYERFKTILAEPDERLVHSLEHKNQ